jgi:hypothetical protein
MILTPSIHVTDTERNVAQSKRFTLSFQNIAIVFRMLLIAYIRVTDTERNITRKYW